MAQAIPFINIDEETGSMEITPESMAFLESLSTEKKVIVIAIAGPYRSGKSFLANRLLN